MFFKWLILFFFVLLCWWKSEAAKSESVKRVSELGERERERTEKKKKKKKKERKNKSSDWGRERLTRYLLAKCKRIKK